MTAITLPREVPPMPTPVIPDSYRLLSRFSGIPKLPHDAYREAGMWHPGAGPTVAHMQVLRRLRNERLIRWVRWVETTTEPGPDGKPRKRHTTLHGFVLTGEGEAVLSTYFDLYGPTLTVPTPDANEVALD